MREILFRGKRMDNGEWVEGGYFFHYGECRIVAEGTVCGMDFYGPVLAVGAKGEGFASIRGSAVPAILKLLNGRDCR